MVFALVMGVASADTLLFKDDLELSGPKVEVLREHEKGVDVKVSHGTITIQWSRIKNISIDYESHLANMTADGRDNARGLHEFAKLLVRHDMLKEAAQTCGLIVEKDRVAEDILFGVAKQMERQKAWRVAKKAYEKILTINPSRRDVAKRIDQITGFIKKDDATRPADPKKQPNGPPKQEPKQQPVKDPGTQPKPQPTVRNVTDYLEAEDEWEAEPWGNQATVQIDPQTREETIDGQVQLVRNRVLSVNYNGRKDKVAIRLGGTWDLTNCAALVFDVWNGGTGSFGLSVAFNTLPGWQFFESPSVRVPPRRWTTVRIDVTSRRFKSAASRWRNTSLLVNRDNVKQVILLVYNSATQGRIYFDNIRFVDAAGRAR